MNGISFSVNGVELTIPSTRLWDYTNGNCTLLVESGNFGFWILGNVFLDNFYVLFNMDNKSVSLAPSVNSVIPGNSGNYSGNSSYGIVLLFSLIEITLI